MILEQIAASTRRRVEQEKMERPLERVREMALEMARTEQASPSPVPSTLPNSSTFNPFESALRKPGMSFICEVKKASPSKGVIAEEFHYREIASDYERAGADAISVLTEPEYFQGCSMYLEEIHRQVRLPLLRKDFVVDEYQIYDAKLLGASAVLLICSLLKEDKLRRNALRLRRLVPPETIFVAESGIRTAEDIRRLSEARVDAVLIGETLMRAKDRTAALNELRRGCIL